MNYTDQLRDVRWQKKRLEVMKRDKFQCIDCGLGLKDAGVKQVFLNVHHSRYLKGKAPWDHPKKLLVTLCEACHHRRHNPHKEIRPINENLDGKDSHELAEMVKLGLISGADYWKQLRSILSD